MTAIGWWLAAGAWVVLPFSVKWMLNAWGLDVEMTWRAYGATYFFFAITWVLAARAAAVGWRHGRAQF